MWQPSVAPLWAELDLLAAAARRNSEDKQFQVLDPNAAALTGAAYPHQASDVIERGLLADVLAQALQQLADVPPPTTSPRCTG